MVKSFRIIDEGYYQWKNHLVIHGKMNSVEKLKKRLALLAPKAEVKSYENPVYSFTNFERCKDSKPAQEWDNIVLTANLVDDEKLQQEYLEYHKTQFEKWREVSKGFCNADFQQLQVFKNGRQLLLVIIAPIWTI